MWRILLIAAFGGLGAVSRYGLSVWTEQLWGKHFPIGTLSANLIGCLLIGVLFQISQAPWVSLDWQRALGVGFLGSLTTFSAFGLETFRMLELGHWRSAGINVMLNLVVGLLAVWLGIALAKACGATS